MYGGARWIIKKAERQRIDAFRLRCWRRLLKVPWTARRSNQSILNTHYKDWCWSSNTLAIGKDPDAGKDWRWEEKGTTEDEMVGWHHQLNGHDFERAPEDDDGQGSLVCFSPWDQKSRAWLRKWTTTSTWLVPPWCRHSFRSQHPRLSTYWCFNPGIFLGETVRAWSERLFPVKSMSSPRRRPPPHALSDWRCYLPGVFLVQLAITTMGGQLFILFPHIDCDRWHLSGWLHLISHPCFHFTL